MPDGFTTSDSQQIAQRGFRGGFPRGRFPRGRFPRRFPIRRRFPRPVFPIIFPPFFGFPTDRCFFIDRWGRCCDRWGRCCDRWGRCFNQGWPYAGADTSDSWYGVAGSWDMMPDMDDDDDMDSTAVFNDFVDYDD